MTTSSPTSASSTEQRPGDICPPWCGPDHVHTALRDSHPDDDQVIHERVVDAWVSESGNGIVNGVGHIVVSIHGVRHDKPQLTPDWPDVVEADGDLNPGCMNGVSLKSGDARRLAAGLNMGSTILEEAHS